MLLCCGKEGGETHFGKQEGFTLLFTLLAAETAFVRFFTLGEAFFFVA